MIALITGDIINSHKIKQQDTWLLPLKELLTTWGKQPRHWEIFRGDNFQLEINNPYDALNAALLIKALIKSIPPEKTGKQTADIDVRMAIGIGTKTFTAERITESNGDAFVFSGRKYDMLKKEKRTLAVQTAWTDFDSEINLFLKLACLQMDKWTVTSAQVMQKILQYQNKNQTEIGKLLGIEQNTVSNRWKRSNADEIIDVEKMFQHKLNKQL